jgi:hypothetical protein
MLAPRKQLQVLDPVVPPIAVDVMDIFVGP